MTRPDSENVFVGISLAKKWSVESVEETVRLARNHFSARRILFLIADELEFINLRTLSPGGAKSLRAQVDRRAGVHERVVCGVMADADTSQLGWSIARWCAILDRGYWSLYNRLLGLYVESTRFRREVNALATAFAASRAPERALTRGELHHLSLYVVAELPTIMAGVRVGAKRYPSMIYPSTEEGARLDHIAGALQTGRFGTRVPKTCAIVRFDV